MAGFTPTVRMTVPVRQLLPRSAVVPRAIPGNYGEVAPGSVRLPPSFAGITPATYDIIVPAAQREFLTESARIARELEDFNNRPAPAPREQKAMVRKASNKTVKVSRRKILEGWEDTTSVRNAPVTRAEVILRGGDPGVSAPMVPVAGVAPLPPGAPMGVAPFKGYGNAIPPHIQQVLDERAKVADALVREDNAVREQVARSAADDRLVEGIYKEAYADQATAPFRPGVVAEAKIEAARAAAGKLKEDVKQGVKDVRAKAGSALRTAVGYPMSKANQKLAAVDNRVRGTLPGYIVSRIWHSKDPTGRRDRLWKFLGAHPASVTTTAVGLAAVGYGLKALFKSREALEEGDRVAAMNSAERGDSYNQVVNRLARLERDAGEIASGSVSQDNQLRDMGRYAGQMSGIGEALLHQLGDRIKAAGDDAQARTNAMLRAAADYSAAYRAVEGAMEKAGAADLFRRWNDDMRAAGRTVSPEDFARGLGLKEVPDGR